VPVTPRAAVRPAPLERDQVDDVEDLVDRDADALAGATCTTIS
jgi:hypothetical protein